MDKPFLRGGTSNRSLPFTVAEFFAGIGLMRLGLEHAGWQTVFANDIDAKKGEMYVHHFGPSPEFILGDIHNLDPACVPATTLATASFPCNNLSLAGARKGLAGQHSSAFWGFIRILRELGGRRPPLVLLENVAGFLTSHGGADLHAALLALNDLGYNVDAFTLDAARFVPHSRVRFFIVGEKMDSGKQPLPAKPVVSDTRNPQLIDFIHARKNLQWSLRPLPPLPTHKTRLADLLECIPADSTIWWNDVRKNYLLNQMSAKHRALADAMIRAPGLSHGAVFRRVRAAGSMAELRTDGLAGCLRTPRGGSGRQILFAAGDGRFAVRLLTARECARLMGAGEFRIAAPLHQALFGFGDAVCVPVIRWIAENYLNHAARKIASQKICKSG